MNRLFLIFAWLMYFSSCVTSLTAQDPDYVIGDANLSDLTMEELMYFEESLLYVEDIEPAVDDDGEMIYEVTFILLSPVSEEPEIIDATIYEELDPGDLLEVEGVAGPGPPPGGEGGGDNIGANDFKLVDVEPSKLLNPVKLKENKTIKIGVFSSPAMDMTKVDELSFQVGDPSLKLLGSNYVSPYFVKYKDLNGDGYDDALLYVSVGWLLGTEAIDELSTTLEVEFNFRGLPISGEDFIDVIVD